MASKSGSIEELLTPRLPQPNLWRGLSILLAGLALIALLETGLLDIGPAQRFFSAVGYVQFASGSFMTLRALGLGLRLAGTIAVMIAFGFVWRVLGL